MKMSSDVKYTFPRQDVEKFISDYRVDETIIYGDRYEADKWHNIIKINNIYEALIAKRYKSI